MATKVAETRSADNSLMTKHGQTRRSGPGDGWTVIRHSHRM